MSIREQETKEKGFSLTFKEILLLLQSVGAERINGIEMEQEPITDEEVVLIMDSMVRKGILHADGDVFRMEETVGRMIRCMGWPDKGYRAEMDGMQVYCYERGDDLLITRLSPVRDKTVSMVLRRK